MDQATGLTVMPSLWKAMEESCSCSGKKRRKGDHHQRPQQLQPEQMSGMAEAGITGIIDPDVLDCTICFHPLRPPVFQVSSLHPNSLLFVYQILARFPLYASYADGTIVSPSDPPLRWEPAKETHSFK